MVMSAREEPQHVLLRVGAAPLDEAHVVHDHQAAERTGVAGDRIRRDVQRAVAQLQHPAPRFPLLRGRALHRLRKGRAREREMARAIAKADGEDALALHDALEVALHSRPRAARIAHQLGERLLRGLRDQRAARVEVAHEPLEREAIDQRHHRIGDRREREGERYDEAKR
jgi:hypothetical protein